MAKVSAFTFTNKTASANTITPLALGLTSNYAVSTEVANQAVLNNKTADIDAMELISYRTQSVKSVANNLDIRNPAKVTSGIQYGVQVEETLVTTDSDDATFRVDEPIVASINIRHPKSGNIDNSVVAEVVLRLISSLMRADGSWRFDDLMRSAERPIAD
jgi:hypothetical protein